MAKSISQREYAKHRGVYHSAVRKAIQSGRIRVGRKGKVDPDRADAEWARNTAPRPGKKKSPKASASSGSSRTSSQKNGAGYSEKKLPPSNGYAEARAIREKFLAATARIDYEERTGALVRFAEVERATFKKYRAFRDAILNVPGRVDAQLAAETNVRKVNDILTAELRKALFDFSKPNN